MPNEIKSFHIEGTPLEIGSEVFLQLCAPIINEAGQHMPPEDRAKLYAGFIGTALRAMAVDFTPEAAVSLARALLERLNTMHPETKGH